MHMKSLFALPFFLLGLCAPAFAQQQTLFIQGEESDVARAKTYVVDTVVPTAPAFALLNVDTPQGIGAPFGGDSYFNVAQSGGGLPDVGLSLRPYWTLFESRRNSLNDYREENYLSHVWARTQISAAVARMPGEPARTGVAFGISTSLSDRTDPRLDSAFDGCLLRVLARRDEGAIGSDGAGLVIAALSAADVSAPANLETALSASTWSDVPRIVAQGVAAADRRAAMAVIAAQLPAWRAAWVANAEKGVDTCVEAASERYLLRDDVTIGAGAFGRSDSDSNLDGLAYQGASLWIGYRRTLTRGVDNPATDEDEREAIGQINLYARYERRENTEFANAVVSDSDTTIVFGSYAIEGERWRATLAASWNDREYSNPALPSTEFARYSGSVEYNLGDVSGRDTWIEFGYGALSEDVPDEDSYGFVRLKFNTTSRQ